MGFLSNLLQKPGALKSKKATSEKSRVNISSRQKGAARRHFDAAKHDRLLAGFVASGNSSNANLRAALPVLRSRSRALCDNNGYAKKILKMTVSNVVGPSGFNLRVNIKKKNGKADKKNNEILEKAWKEWGKVGVASACGKLSWVDCQKLFIKCVARDGEGLVRFVTGPSAGNKFGFALQFLEADHLDINKRGRVGENEIEMGVETNPFGRPMAYHILKEHPGDFKAQGQDWIRLNADDVLHEFSVDRPGQMRGIPLLTPVMNSLHMLDGYIEAELVSKRVSASKMGFIEDLDGEEYVADEVTEDGEVISDMEAGVIEELPAGKKFHGFDPQHDGKGMLDFLKVILRGTASGTGGPYHSISNDLSDVNFSSIRSGVLEARDDWRGEQEWMISAFCEKVFRAWLSWSLTMGTTDLLVANEEAYAEGCSFRGRGWQWVDPLKDAQANKLRREMFSKSLTQIAAEEGRTIEDVLEEIIAEQELIKSNNIEPLGDGNERPGDALEDDKED